jgi:hypothetical protein
MDFVPVHRTVLPIAAHGRVGFPARCHCRHQFDRTGLVLVDAGQQPVRLSDDVGGRVAGYALERGSRQ